MKKLLFTLSFSVLFACSESMPNSEEDIRNDIAKSTERLVQKESDDAIQSLRYIMLRDNRYYLDEEGARKGQISNEIISRVKKDLLDVNKALQEREEFLQKNRQNIRAYDIELIDFQKIDIDSLKVEYSKRKTAMSASALSGYLSTTGQSERIITVYNPDNTKAVFTAYGRTAIISFHTFGASSTFGGWQYKDVTGSFAAPVTREISLYTNKDNLRLSYRTSDPKGGVCGYKLQ